MYKKSVILKKIRENLSKGSGVFNACNAAGVPYGTVWTWRNRRPMIERYFQKLLMQRVQLVEDALYKGAISGNTTAQIFYLKNRGKGWADGPIVDQSNKVTFNVNWVIDGKRSYIAPQSRFSLEEPESL